MSSKKPKPKAHNPLNPDSVGLDNVMELSDREFRLWNFIKLKSIDERTSELDKRLWWVLGSVVTLGIVAILAAVI
jgi:hypothetical protein